MINTFLSKSHHDRVFINNMHKAINTREAIQLAQCMKQGNSEFKNSYQ